jgi:hypothetical protein
MNELLSQIPHIESASDFQIYLFVFLVSWPKFLCTKVNTAAPYIDSIVSEGVWNEPRTVTTSVLVLRQSYALTTQLDFRNLLEKKALLMQIIGRYSSKFTNKKEL